MEKNNNSFIYLIAGIGVVIAVGAILVAFFTKTTSSLISSAAPGLSSI